jgi:hypothetical protein
MDGEEEKLKYLDADFITEKRTKQEKVVSDIINSIENLSNVLQEQQYNLELNKGALIQLNSLLNDLGVTDLDTIDDKLSSSDDQEKLTTSE